MKIARETAAYLRSDRTGEPAVEIVVVSRFWWKRGVTFLPAELRSYST
jgi:hypothetical protein